MPYVVIEDFRFGLDTRRHPLVSPPGTLQTLTNAHINRGGEIEKRYGFTDYWGAPVSLTSITGSGTTATVTTASAHGYSTGAYVVVRDATQTEYNGTFKITVTGATTFTYTMSTSATASPATGSIELYPRILLDDGGLQFIDDSTFYDGLDYGSVNSPRQWAYGLESTDSGLVIFSSAASGDAWAYSYGLSEPPSSLVTIQQLRHPAPRAVTTLGWNPFIGLGTGQAVCPVNHGLSVGDYVYFGGANESIFRRKAVVTGTSTSLAFEFGLTPGAGPATGTVTWEPALTKIRWSTTFNGKAFAIAEFDNGDVYCYYNGTLVNDSFYGRVHDGMSSINDMAEQIKDQINLDTATHGYSAARSGAVVTITGPDANTFTVAGSTVNNGATEDEDIAIAVNTNGTQATTATSATATIYIVSGRGEDINPAPVLSSLTGDGVNLLTGDVTWSTDGTTTAAAIASDVNLGTGTHGYSATSSGAKIVVSAPAGTAENDTFLGWNISVGEMQFADTPDGGGLSQGQTAFSGAEATVSEVLHKVDATFSGTLEVGDLYALTLTEADGTIYRWGYTRITGQDLITAVALKTKMYMAAAGNVFYSKIDDPTVWQEGSNESSGVINMLNEYVGAEEVKALGVYENNLAVFGKNAGFIWFVDPDAASNRLLQVLPNLGAVAPGGVATYGDRDVFFLAESGLRSLRVRDSSGNAAVNDVGVQVDTSIVAEIEEAAFNADVVCSTVEPRTGRFWLGINDAIYVYSRFPGSEISGWSKYEIGNMTPMKFAVYDSQVFVLGTNTSGSVFILSYGGPDKTEYDSSTVTATLPWMDMGKPAHEKEVLGVDIVSTNNWTLSCDQDPTSSDTFETIASFTQPTAQLGRIPMRGISSHFRFKLSHSSTTGAAKIANFIVHYKDLRED